MKIWHWGRLVIVLVVGMGLGAFPFIASAQSEQQPTTIQVRKYVCLGHPDNGCGDGLDSDAAGATFEFVVTNPDTDEEFSIEVTIETSGKGATEVPNVLPGHYKVCESVPEGYEGYAIQGDETQYHEQVTYDNCMIFRIREGEYAVATFYNWREGVEDLPDTGAGSLAATGAAPWVPVLLAGALLMLVAGLRLRPTDAR
jgi:hypothetical protein